MIAPESDRDQDAICTGINCEHCAEHVCKLVVVDGASLIICLEC